MGRNTKENEAGLFLCVRRVLCGEISSRVHDDYTLKAVACKAFGLETHVHRVIIVISLLFGEQLENIMPDNASNSVKSLSVVVLCYNEEATVASVVEQVSGIMQSLGMDYEIIMVNDGSRDRSGEIGRELQTRIPHFKLIEHFPNRGYGGALKAGYAAATCDWIAYVPGDNQFDFREISLLLSRAREADIVSGYRAKRQDPFVRRLNALGWNTVVRLLYGYLCRDIDCGFKLFRRELLEHVHIESNGAMVDTEFLAGARARGYKIADVPVTHLPRTAGNPTGANFKVIFRAFRDQVRFRLRLWRELREERRAWRVERGG